MGTYANSHLAYGIRLGGGDGDEPPYYAEYDDDWDTSIFIRMLCEKYGIGEDDSDGHFDILKDEYGLEERNIGHYDNYESGLMVFVPESYHSGGEWDATLIDVSKLRIPVVWDGRLRKLIENMGFKGVKIGWYLWSTYG